MSRRVIIPPGVLDPNQVNIIQVPKSLENVDVPLLVTPARRGLRAQALPNWKDELSRLVDEESKLHYLDARGVKCRRDEEREARTSRNVTFQNRRAEVPQQMEAPAAKDSSKYPMNSRETTQYSRMQRNSLPRETPGAPQNPYSRSIYGVPSSAPYRESPSRPTSPSVFPSYNGNENRSPSPYRATTAAYPTSRAQSPEKIASVQENEGDEEEEEHSEVVCSSRTPARRVTYLSSTSSKQVDDNPMESESIEIDAPEGIGERRLKQIMEDQAREWRQPAPQKAQKHPSPSQSAYGPYHSPIGDFNNDYYPEQFCYSDGYYDHYDGQYESHDESFS